MKVQNRASLKIEEIDNSYFNCSSLDFNCVFTTKSWLKAYGGSLRRYGVFKGCELQAVFGLHTCRKLGMPILWNPPLTQHCGLIFKTKNGNAASVATWKKNVTETIAKFIDQLPWSVVSIGFPVWIVDLQPFIWRNYKTITRYTYIIDLKNQTNETIFGNMTKSRRKEIRNFNKKGLTVEKCTNFNVVEKLVENTFGRQKVKYPKETIKEVIYHTSKANKCYAFIAFIGVKPIATSFFVYDRTCAYGLFGGHDHNNIVPGAGALVIYECIKYAKKLGLSYFDFGGSSVPNIELFLRSFGGDLVPYSRVVKAKLPVELLLKIFKRNLF
jgi:hypothetical protein